jgi:hypothetical protein
MLGSGKDVGVAGYGSGVGVSGRLEGVKVQVGLGMVVPLGVNVDAGVGSL